jgi:hypothetical protein
MRPSQPAGRAAIRRILASAACFAALAGCGYIGDPLPPSLNIPMRAEDLSAIERNDSIVISFTVPGQTTDGVAIKRLGEVDLRIGPAAGDNWADRGRKVEMAAAVPGPARAVAPAKEWIGQDVVIGVRFAGRTGRFSEWSNLVRMHVSEPLSTPVVAAESAPKGVHLTFAGNAPRPGLGWRIFRRAAGEKTMYELAQQSKAPEYIDATAEFGKPYEYAAQAFLDSGAESEISKPVAITPQDVFPPAVPVGLTAVAAAHSIEVSWEPASEPDLKGYYLYRWLEAGQPQRIGGLLDTPAYSDRDVKSGIQYTYAVSAVDQRGNESARSAPVQAIAQ